MKAFHSLTTAKSLLMAVSIAGIFSCNDATTTDGPSRDTVVTQKDSPSAPVNPPASSTPATHAEANLSGTHADTALTGKAIFDVNNGKVKMVLEITVAAKAGKSVAVHLHEHGDCGDKGEGAHGHWNPTGAQHGKWGSGSFHSGDIGNVKLDKDGKGSVTVETDLWTLGGDAKTNVLGKAVIVHGGVDDYKTQPTGNAGSRIGCGVIQ